eukprot:scaffold21885_cov164-Skeletonema_dohrnii-CCMP3373.AAC.2
MYRARDSFTRDYGVYVNVIGVIRDVASRTPKQFTYLRVPLFHHKRSGNERKQMVERTSLTVHCSILYHFTS